LTVMDHIGRVLDPAATVKFSKCAFLLRRKHT